MNRDYKTNLLLGVDAVMDKMAFDVGVIDLVEMTVDDVQAAVAAGVTSEALTQAFLDRLERYNPYYNAVITPNPTALDDARAIDRRRAAGGECEDNEATGHGEGCRGCGTRGEGVHDERFFSIGYAAASTKVRKCNHPPPLHRGFMGADPGAGPVQGKKHIRERRPVRDDARNEFVHHVRMGASVPAALGE